MVGFYYFLKVYIKRFGSRELKFQKVEYVILLLLFNVSLFFGKFREVKDVCNFIVDGILEVVLGVLVEGKKKEKKKVIV